MTMSDEIRRLTDAQVNLLGKICRTGENLRKIGAAKTTKGVVEACLQGLEKKWNKFDQQDDELFPHRDALQEHEYYKEDLSFLAEEAYLQQKGALLELLQGFTKQEAKAATGTDPSVSSHAPRTMLPRIQLPPFSGLYQDWPSFRDLFSSNIGRDTTISQVEKLHYLRSCLKGEATLLIGDLPVIDENFTRAWMELTRHYENKRLLVRSYLARFSSLPTLKGESVSDLRTLYHGILNTVSSLESIGRPITSSEDLFVYSVVERLDSRLRREWEHSIKDTTEPPSYFTLRAFLAGTDTRGPTAFQGRDGIGFP